MKEYDTSTVCRIINVSRSEYYRTPSKSEREKTEEEKAVINCFNKNKGRYGRIRIRKALEKENIYVSEYKISKILKQNGLVAISGRTGKRKVKKPTEQQYIEENLIKDKFSIKEPNYLWCSDISELRYRNGKFYVCGIIDVATRRIVGWSIDRTQTQTLVQNAFKMAIGRNPKRPENAIYHSDRGCQYTAKKTKELIEKSGFRKSMSRPGTPSDNQPIESFWKTLETELSGISALTFKDASLKVSAYIELYYNSERLHSGIDYHVPNDFLSILSVHNS